MMERGERDLSNGNKMDIFDMLNMGEKEQGKIMQFVEAGGWDREILREKLLLGEILAENSRVLTYILQRRVIDDLMELALCLEEGEMDKELVSSAAQIMSVAEGTFAIQMQSEYKEVIVRKMQTFLYRGTDDLSVLGRFNLCQMTLSWCVYSRSFVLDVLQGLPIDRVLVHSLYNCKMAEVLTTLMRGEITASIGVTVWLYQVEFLARLIDGWEALGEGHAEHFSWVVLEILGGMEKHVEMDLRFLQPLFTGKTVELLMRRAAGVDGVYLYPLLKRMVEWLAMPYVEVNDMVTSCIIRTANEEEYPSVVDAEFEQLFAGFSCNDSPPSSDTEDLFSLASYSSEHDQPTEGLDLFAGTSEEKPITEKLSTLELPFNPSIPAIVENLLPLMEMLRGVEGPPVTDQRYQAFRYLAALARTEDADIVAGLLKHNVGMACFDAMEKLHLANIVHSELVDILSVVMVHEENKEILQKLVSRLVAMNEKPSCYSGHIMSVAANVHRYTSISPAAELSEVIAQSEDWIAFEKEKLGIWLDRTKRLHPV